MSPDTLKKALVKNRYLIVKRTLRLTEQPINEANYSDFDDDASIDTIETSLKIGMESDLTENSDSWFMRLFKR